MPKKSFRVYFITHADGRKTGIMMRNWSHIFDAPAPSAYGADEEEVYRQLEVGLIQAQLANKDDPTRYLWDEEFATRKITIDIHPQTVVEKRAVIAKNEIPLRLTYASSKIPNGGYRVILPRFEWWFIVEDLEVAPEVLKGAISTALLGEHPRWIYDFRSEGEEVVREWSSPALEAAVRHNAYIAPSKFPTLQTVGEELVERAQKGKMPPLVGNESELTAHAPLFLRDRPASLLLVGGPGVGKTTFVRRLAKRLVAEKRDRNRARVPRIWSTSRDRIIAGMVYLGMWQERCLRMLGELANEGDYLYVDRLTAILQPQSDGASIAEVFASAMLAEEISLIAECTESELERARKKAPAFVNAFKIIRIAEPPASEVPLLLQQYAARKNAKTTIHPQGLKRLVRHLEAFNRDTCFPGKAFRFVEWLATEQAEAKEQTIYPRDVSAAYSRFSGLPLELISDEHPATAQTIASSLKMRVIGQDEACNASAAVLARFKAGLNDPTRPCGSLFFAGPTGVGKTELAKALSRYMFASEERMIRIDMSEYMTPGSASRLLDAGEGAKTLAERVREQPLSLVLFDEIEKAHPEVFDLLLGILGEGRLTDALGRFVDFRMVLIVMTSNLGAGDGKPVGFDSAARSDFASSAKRYFRPELWGRIDEVLSFKSLDMSSIEKIVELSIASLSERTGLIRRNLRLVVSPEAKKLLAELGYHPTRGARPLKRVVEEKVITPVAVRMARDPAFREREIPVVTPNSPAWTRLSESERTNAVLIEDSGERAS